jgi:hypothetical protein
MFELENVVFCRTQEERLFGSAKRLKIFYLLFRLCFPNPKCTEVGGDIRY